MNLPINFDKSNVLVLLPAYNEGPVIGQVLEKIKTAGYSNICVVNDGSSDQTGAIVKQSEAQLLEHLINRGAGAAVQTGIAFAKEQGFKYAVLMDSDGQHLPEDIERLYEKMHHSNADIVVGNRFTWTQNEVPRHRVAYNQIANVFTNIFCKKSYTDTQSGFQLLNRKAIENIHLKSRGFGFCSEMLIYSEKANLLVEETPIQVRYTNYSLKKGQNLKEGVRTAKSILWRVIFG